MDIQLHTKAAFKLNKKQASTIQSKLDRQHALYQKFQDLNQYTMDDGDRRCCKKNCAKIIGVSLLEAARQEYAKILDIQLQSMFLYQEFRDDSVRSGFSFR